MAFENFGRWPDKEVVSMEDNYSPQTIQAQLEMIWEVFADGEAIKAAAMWLGVMGVAVGGTSAVAGGTLAGLRKILGALRNTPLWIYVEDIIWPPIVGILKRILFFWKSS